MAGSVLYCIGCIMVIQTMAWWMKGPHLCYFHKEGVLKLAVGLISVADGMFSTIPGTAALLSPSDRCVQVCYSW